MKQPAIFLDRDGVIIENCSNYVRSWADVEVFPQALEALAAVRHSPYRIVLVTNQSAVGRGHISIETAEAINDRLLALIREAGGRVDAVYMCPHGPDDGCDCRKPRPGLLLRAAEELDLDLSRSVMIGDALTDVQAGQSAGVRQAILLRTGRGGDQERLPAAGNLPPFVVYDTLADALDNLSKSLP
jgi:D-glycero-D-manno-heptose 1,7-bisphosphate phosphatase